MNLLIDLIKAEAGNSSAVFVFPSEAAADFWKKELLRMTAVRAVRDDRFISWDSFKESITKHERLEKPVNSVIRRLFAADIVKRNSSAPLFKRLIPAEFSVQSGAFADSLRRILPELKPLLGRAEESENFSVELKSDLQIFFREYSAFLSANSLFEPSWELPELDELRKSYIIAFPRLIEDWREYETRLVAAGCRTVDGYGSRPDVSMVQYENSEVEVNTVLSRIAGLLEAGERPSEIVVTAADDGAGELLAAAARLRGLPLQLRRGRPLADYPAGRLPFLIQGCRQSAYSLASMKSLLLFRAFVWKEASAASELIRFGIENRCLKNTASSVYGDIWAERLKAAGRSDLLSFYRRLRSRIEALCGCRSFSELSAEFQLFVGSFLITDAEQWDPVSEQIFQRCREVLAALRETETLLSDLQISDPLGLWIEVLQEKIYVRRQGLGAVPLYPYRVSAGMVPEHHFIIGMSHSSSAVISQAFGFLSERDRRALEADENNMSEDFIDVYGLSGRKVYFSGSAESFSGAELPPGRFIELSAVEKAPGFQECFYDDPYFAEPRWWADGGVSQFRPSALQLEGFKYALETYIGGSGFDASAEIVDDPDLLYRLLEKRFDKDGRIRISASALNRWSECPFRYLIQDILTISEDEYILQPEDPMTAGMIMHEILHDFFKEMLDRSGSFDPEKIDQYRERLRRLTDAVFKRWEAGENYFFGPAWDSLRRRADSWLSAFPAAEAEFFGGWRPSHLESWLDHVFEDEAVTAGGYVDRISGNGTRSVIIDYKKSWSKKSRAKYISSDSAGAMQRPEPGYQLPFYILLAEAAGLGRASAAYYSISGGEYFPVSGERGVLSDDDVTELVEFTKTEIIRMAKAMRSGDFRTPARCDGCELRSVCRKRYSVRWKG